MADLVTAWAFTPGSDVRFEIYNSAGGLVFGPATRRTDASGNHWLTRGPGENPGHGHDFTGGERVVVTDLTTGTVKTLLVPPLAVTNVDAATDTVSGRAGPGDSVEVMLMSPISTSKTVTANAADGTWSVTFRPDYDIKPGTQLGAQVQDPDWDLAQTNPSGCPPYSGLQCSVIASIEADAITAFAFTPNSDVTFEVFNPDGTRAYGPVTKKTDSQGAKIPALPELVGYYALDLGLEPGDPDLVPGSKVVVTDVATSTVKTVDVLALSVTRVDIDADVVAGRAPPGTVVEVSAMNRHLGKQVTAAADGTWSVNVRAEGINATPEDWFAAHARDADWDETSDDQGAPVPGCEPDPNTVCGTAGEDTLRAGGGGAALQGLSRGRRRGLLVKAGLRDDTILLRLRRTGLVTVYGGSGGDGILLDPERNPRTTAHVIVNGEAGDETIIVPARAGSLRVTFMGGSGNDVVRARRFRGKGGSGGSYRLSGGTGTDRLVGGTGNDVLVGGPGRDVMVGGRGRDTCVKGPQDKVSSCEVVRRSK